MTQFYYPHVGGVEKHVENLTRILVSLKYSVTILTEQYDPNLPLVEKYKGVTVMRIPISSNAYMKKFFIWKWVLFHLSYIRSFDVIHIHDVFYYVLPFRAFLIGKKIFMTFHGYEGFPIRKRWIVARKIAENLTHGNICVGEFMKKWYRTRPTKIIYGAVSKNEAKFRENVHSAIFFGRLDDQTGILEYIKAYSMIKKRFGKFKMTVVGEGGLRSQIPKDITVLPFTKNVDEIIGEHKFIFVSRYLSMLEALIQKKDVIAVYDNEVKKDYLLMSPFKKYVFIAKNSKEIADYVGECLGSPSFSRQKRNEGAHWAQNMTWDSASEAYLSLWGLRI